MVSCDNIDCEKPISVTLDEFPYHYKIYYPQVVLDPSSWAAVSYFYNLPCGRVEHMCPCSFYTQSCPALAIIRCTSIGCVDVADNKKETIDTNLDWDLSNAQLSLVVQFYDPAIVYSGASGKSYIS